MAKPACTDLSAHVHMPPEDFLFRVDMPQVFSGRLVAVPTKCRRGPHPFEACGGPSPVAFLGCPNF